MPKKELIDKSLQKLIKEKPYIVTHKPGFPNIGTREDKQKYGDAVRKIEIAWDFYDVSLYNIKEQKSTIKLGSGNPIDYKPFPDAVKALRHNQLRKSYQYPPAAGDEICRKQIVDYLIEDGVNKVNFFDYFYSYGINYMIQNHFSKSGKNEIIIQQ